jgi:hypothetical protein
MKSVTRLHRSSAIQAYRELLVWDFHPLVIRAVRAHALLHLRNIGSRPYQVELTFVDLLHELNADENPARVIELLETEHRLNA